MVHYLNQGLLYRWTEHSILPMTTEGGILNSNNATKTHSIHICKTVKKTFFRHAKGIRKVNFYIVNALGQKLANSESCPILGLLQEAKICNFCCKTDTKNGPWFQFPITKSNFGLTLVTRH